MKPQFIGSVLDVGDAEEIDGLIGQVGEVDELELVPHEVHREQHPDPQHRGHREDPNAEDEDADEDDAVEARGGVDVVLGAAPRGGDPGLDRRVGAAREVDGDVRRAAAEEREDGGEQHGQAQVEPHRRRQRRRCPQATDLHQALRICPPFLRSGAANDRCFLLLLRTAAFGPHLWRRPRRAACAATGGQSPRGEPLRSTPRGKESAAHPFRSERTAEIGPTGRREARFGAPWPRWR